MNQQILKLQPKKVRKQMSVETLKKKSSFYNEQPDGQYKQMVRYEQMLSSLLRQKYEEKRNQIATKEFLPLMIDQKSKIVINSRHSKQIDSLILKKQVLQDRVRQLADNKERHL